LNAIRRRSAARGNVAKSGHERRFEGRRRASR
jgi:hypothetical protein